MSTAMKASEFVKKLKDIANNYKTLYVMGCFGAPMTETNKERYCNNHKYNTSSDRRKFIRFATSDTFGFDCVCLIKGVLWGWSGDKAKTYGGAKYNTNNVPDIGANAMIKVCKDLSTDFSKIDVGEAVWCEGHIGVYIGDGLAVECTPKWKNGVQITAVKNIGTKSGYNARTWTKHGKLPYIKYDVVEAKDSTTNKLKYKVGETVKFVGSKQYASANASSSVAAKGDRAIITAISEKGKHPYHIRSVNKLGKFISGVYGWVDADCVKGLNIITVNLRNPSGKVDSAQKKDSSLAGKYKVNASSGLHIRSGAGTSKSSLGVLKDKTIVYNYGFYTNDRNGIKWLYVKTDKGLEGFCHSNYLTKC